MHRLASPCVVVLWLFIRLGSGSGARAPLAPTGGCDIPAAVSLVVGSGGKPEKGNKVIDSNLRSKWVSFGDGESLWLEIAIPTVIDSVAIAFRKGNKRVHSFSIFLITTDNEAELVYKGTSSGDTNAFQNFPLGDKAKEAVAVTIVGHGNSRNMWNGYAEVELCAREAAVVETHSIGVIAESSSTAPKMEVELPFPDGRKGFNIVNMCSFPIRVGSTGSQTECGVGTAINPHNDKCFWALPEGQRDLVPRETVQYVLPELALKDGSLIWAGIIWASTGCTSDISGDYDHPTTDTCVTNYCPDEGNCQDYNGPAGVTTKAEFAMQEGGLDFYDVSIIDGANIPMSIVPINPVFSINEHYCGSPGSTEAFGDLGACSWSFAPDAVDTFLDDDLSPYTKVVWPNDPDKPTPCLDDSQCQEASEGVCGIYEERSSAGSSKTNSFVPKVCGRPIGWTGPHSACGATKKASEDFPNDYPYFCDKTTSDGTLKQLYRCSGEIYGSQACYLVGAQESCCGCPPWDESNGGCISTNPEWTESAYPWAKFFKTACPTAYSFPRDDRTSMFVCSNAAPGAEGDELSKNTQSYSIQFCPGDSEEKFYPK